MGSTSRERAAVQAQDRLLGRTEATVQEDRPEQGLERISQDGWPRIAAAFQLAFAHAQALAERKRLRNLIQRLLPHQVGAQPRQIAFTGAAKPAAEFGRDDAVENAVPEELEALVVGRAVASVRERLPEQRRLRKPVADGLLQPPPVHALPCVQGNHRLLAPANSISRLTLPTSLTFFE